MNRLTRWTGALALSLAAIALAAPSANAAVAAKSGTIEIVTGWYWPESQTGADFHDDFTYGVRGGYNFTRHFGLQGAIQGFDTSANNAAPIVDTTKDALTVDLSFEWLANPDAKAVFELYGGPGYAWQNTNWPGPKNTDSDDVMTWHLGIGTKISITDNFYIRPGVTARWFGTDENPAGAGSDGHTDVEATVAFGWYIGGE